MAESAVVIPVGAGDNPLLFSGDTELNCPFLQVSPYGTEKPHAPQLSESVWRYTHVPLHRDIPAEHRLLTGRMPEPLEIPVMFGVPADSGGPESTKNAAAAMMRIMPIIPSTLAGDNNTPEFGGGGDCMGWVDGGNGGVAREYAGIDGGDRKVLDASLFMDAP